MKTRRPVTCLSLAATALFAAAPAVTPAVALPRDPAAATARAAKKLVFTTKSDEARKAVEEAVLMIERFQGQAMLPVAQKAVAADPNFAFGHYLVGTAQPPDQGKPHTDKALELAKSASDGERRYIEAVMLVRSGQTEKALPTFEALAKEYPDERMVRMMLGQVYMNANRLDEARAAFEVAAKLDASTPRVHAFLGNIGILKGEYPAARSHFEKAKALTAPKTVPFQAYYGLAYTHVYEGNIAPAIKTLEAFEKVYNEAGGVPGLPPVFIYNSIGRLYLENGDPTTAIKLYEKGYQTVIGSNIPEEEKQIWLGRLHHGKGRALAKLGKHQEAWKEAETIKQMIEAGGEHAREFWPAYHYIAGYLTLEAGKYGEAIEHLKQAHQDDVFHRLLLARAYEKAGDATNAQAIYREIVASTIVNLERAIAYPEAKRKLKAQ